MAQATEDQASNLVIMEVYWASNKKRLVARIMEKNIDKTETPF